MGRDALLRKIGTNLRDARLQAGLRQVDVNELAGLTYRHYQNIEAGKINVTIETLWKLARLFKVKLHELFHDC